MQTYNYMLSQEQLQQQIIQKQLDFNANVLSQFQSNQEQILIDYLDIQFNLSKLTGDKLSTTVFNSMMNTIDIPIDNQWYYLQPLRMTTQTVVIELSNISFNDFRVDMSKMEQCLNKLQDEKQIPFNLVEMKSKRFQIKFGKTLDYQHSYTSKTKEMNSSINFIFTSILNHKKQYKLRLFRNGMLQIPGVLELYQTSEIMVIVDQLIHFYKKIFEVQYQIDVLFCYAVMTNYISTLNLQTEQRIDFIKMVQDIQTTKKETLLNICKQTGVECTHFDTSKRRIVLYIKLIVDKQKLQFSKYNALSTSNRKVFSSITLLVTQRGIVLVQGCPESYSQTSKVLKTFQLICKEIFGDYIVIPPKQKEVKKKQK